MRFRFVLAVVAVVCTWVVGCNSITGIGNLTFTDDAGGTGGSGGGGSGGSSGSSSGSSSGISGPVPPSGTHVVTSSTLELRGMTTDGYVAYGDTSAGTLSVVGVEQPDGGPPASTTPLTLGPADLATSNAEGKLVLFFSPGTEADAGPSRVGTLNAWSASLGTPRVVSAGVLEPILGSFFTVAASADGQYLTYLGAVAPDGATASLFLEDLQSGTKRQLVSSIDVLRDVCQPRINFSGPYVVASYCQVPSGGTVPDAGLNHDIATLTSFVAATGQAATLATNVNSRFGVDPNGVAAIMLSPSGIVASPLSGAGGLVAIDPAGASGIISDDGKTIVYSTTAKALKRGSTSAPVNATQLVSGSFTVVSALSSDTNWVIGALSGGSQSGTSDLYLASAKAPGSATPLSTATTATVGSAGDSFTADSKFALYLTAVSSSWVGTLNAYPLGGSGGAITVGGRAYEVSAVTGSQIVFNLNESGGKADLEWKDLAVAGTPTVIVSAADDFFLLGPANDKIAYTFSSGGGSSSDGLWIVPVPGATGADCGGAGGPITYHPPAGPAGSCTAQEVQAYDTGCVASSATSTTCAAVTISAACHSCLYTQLSASPWGPIVSNPAGGGVDQLNPAACYAQQGHAECAAALQAELECEDNTCASSADLTSFETCQTNADTSKCACYVSNADAACAPFSSSVCNPASYSSFEAIFMAIAPVICE